MDGSDPPPSSRKTASSSSAASGTSAPIAAVGSQPAPSPRSNAPSHHRQSFAENLRNPPPSPRAQRTPSFTQQAIQDLLKHPPANRQPNPRFAGRDWRDVAIGELVAESEIRWAEMDMSVEDATMALVKNNPSNIVLIRDHPNSKTPVSTFDYNDLNSYLLVVVGLAKPDEEHVALYRGIATRAQERIAIPLKDIQPMVRKEDLVRVSAEKSLSQAIEILGSGIHFVIVVNPAGEAVGVLSQLKILEFFWNEGVNFPAIDRLYAAALKELQVGTQQIIAINADEPLPEALTLMHNEGLTSVAVVDHGLNVTGNISTADVRHLTNAASLPLLQQSCMHFVSVILSERGVDQGRDSFPVFYVNPHSTLAHTVAKLVATRSHRMWVVESPSPSPSAPATPLLAPATVSPSSSTTAPAASAPGQPPAPPIRETTVLLPANSTGSSAQISSAQAQLQPAASPSAFTGASVGTSVPSAALPGAHLSGRLTGVVSLTDILNLFARAYGLQPSDPGEQRARRRRSSSSQSRTALEGLRRSMDSGVGSRR